MLALIKRVEPQLGDVEDSYRLRYLRADIAQTLIFVLIVILASLAFVPIDIGLLRDRPGFLTLTLALRTIIILCSMGFGLLLRRIDTPRGYDRLVFGYTVLIALGQGVGAATRPVSYYGTATFDIILILYIYLIVPNALRYRVVSAVVVSLVSLATLFLLREPSLLYWTSIPIAMLGAHLIGLISSTRAYTYRRQEFRAIHEAQLLNERLTVLAEVDALTGAFNRRKLLELGADEFSRYKRYGNHFSLMVADVDHFKRINDRHGHAAGDAVLIAVVAIMLAGKRATDSLGRLGGEEFALLLPETSHAAALRVAERIRQQVQEAKIDAGQGVITVTFSAGVVEIAPDDSSFDDLLRRADQLLYQAKERGRNRIEA